MLNLKPEEMKYLTNDQLEQANRMVEEEIYRRSIQHKRKELQRKGTYLINAVKNFLDSDAPELSVWANDAAYKIEDLITKSPWTVRNFIDDCLIADRHNEKEGEI